MILPEHKPLGILGGGQLGQMFTLAARSMGYRVICFEPAPTCPTGTLTQHIQADFQDTAALTGFAQQCSAITLEFENIPVSAVQHIEQFCPVHPSSKVLQIAQHRATEKNHLKHIGLPTTDFAIIESEQDLTNAWAHINCPSILKIATLGYDGKGQIKVTTRAQLQAAFAQLGHRPCVLEAQVDLAKEISVIVCRNAAGEHTTFPIAENIHANGILDTTLVPAKLNQNLAQRALQMATTLAESLNYIGVLAIEFFINQEQQLMINEIAPRPHNSGHYTINACLTSQFQQQVKMMCGFTPGSTRLHTPAVMKNLLGDLWAKHPPAWEPVLNEPNSHLHLYAKQKPRPGRKMGHFTCLNSKLDAAIEQANQHMTHLRNGCF